MNSQVNNDIRRRNIKKYDESFYFKHNIDALEINAKSTKNFLRRNNLLKVLTLKNFIMKKFGF